MENGTKQVIENVQVIEETKPTFKEKLLANKKKIGKVALIVGGAVAAALTVGGISKIVSKGGDDLYYGGEASDVPYDEEPKSE